MESSIAILKEKIRRVFADVPPPAEDRIIEHDCDECFELRDAFKGKDWRTLPGELIEKHVSSLPLFSPWAFRYFLPAYMLHSLDNFNGDFEVTEFTAYALAPSGEKQGSDYEATRAVEYKFFTAPELEAMCEFSELAERYLDLDKTLIRRGRERMKKYWELGQKIELSD